jgi:threonine dehydrogenase-like Zn-dependent dehydrogenase
VKALTFDIHAGRLAFAKIAGLVWPGAHVSGLGALRLETVPDPTPHGDDWVIVEPRLAGICGSDVMQVFLEAAVDNPLSAVVSAPHVLGHEVVGTVVERGPAVRAFEKGDRVAVSPWLSCAPRGLAPCAACIRGEYALCGHFFDGHIARGMHAGNCRDVGGAFAETMALHESMLFRIPDEVPFEVAVLADPFAVALHAVLRAPPEPGETALVLGCGALGTLLLQVLSALFPSTRILAVDTKPDKEGLAKRLGAERLMTSKGRALVEEIGELVGAPVRRPFFGLPWLERGVDRVYDAVGSPRTLEVALRVARPRATVVIVGVARPGRFEWTPLYFKEIAILGSNAYGLETVGNKRAHAIVHFLELVREGRLPLCDLVTHRYPLERYGDAFLASYDKKRSGALKVIFDRNLA